ncbi:MAG TPA: hypothetical protein VJ715_05315, partial [Pyrinomonadaceae bacterium]|nr:hypothetical protein [Pyrinomonadaceae bacterium]
MVQSDYQLGAVEKLDGDGKFNTVERGDRLRPRPSDRAYWHLKLVLDKMQRVAASDLLPPGERLLDYGCGNKPYRPVFSPKFNEY